MSRPVILAQPIALGRRIAWRAKGRRAAPPLPGWRELGELKRLRLERAARERAECRTTDS